MRNDVSRGRSALGDRPSAPRTTKRWADSPEEAAAYFNRPAAPAICSRKPAGRAVDQFCETLDFLPGDFPPADAARREQTTAEATTPPQESPPQESLPQESLPESLSAPAGVQSAAMAAEPPLPAAEPRETVRFRVEQARGNRLAERRRDLPCWLTSMVLHMALVIVLGSLAAPPVARRLVGATLLLSFAAEETDASSQEPSLVAMELVRGAENQRGDASPAESLDRAAPSPAGRAGADELAEPAPEASSLEPPFTNLTARIPEPRQSPAAPQPPQPQWPPLASAPASRAPPPASLTAGANRAKPQSNLLHERQFDDVVNRFIEYDIGRLQGAEGQRARREFDALGPEAIPALVRGLNKAAKIYASCPVVVISNKLGELAHRDRDPEVLEYVVDNVGKGVPANAPHMARLRAIKEQLFAELRGEPPPSSSDSADLVHRLSSPQPEVRIAAANEIAQHAGAIDADSRADLAWRLIRDLTHRRLDVRDAAHQALVVLAQGDDFGPDEGKLAPAKEASAAAARWYAHFDRERFEAMAASVLASARHFENARRRTSAIRYYRKLIEEYAGAQAADEAGRRLKELTGEQP